MSGNTRVFAAASVLVILSLACASKRGFVSGDRTPSIDTGSPLAATAGRSAAARQGAGGSRSTTMASAVTDYLVARGKDLLDPFKVGVGPGIFAGADVEATMLCHFGVGYAPLNALFGLNNGYPMSLESILGFPITNYYRGQDDGWRGALVCHSHSLLNYLFFVRWDTRPGETDFPMLETALIPLFLTYKDGRFGSPLMLSEGDVYHPIRWMDLEAGLTVVPVACRVGLSPGEAVDCVLGWIGIDLSGDDRRPLLDRKGRTNVEKAEDLKPF